jgi:hypothetical protein
MNSEQRALLVASGAGLIVNFASDSLGTSPLVLGIVVVVAILLIAATQSKSPRLAKSEAAKGIVLSLKFFLTMFVIGAAIGAISVIPLFPLRKFQLSLASVLPQSGILGLNGSLLPFYGYELLAASIVAGLGVVAIFLRQTLTQTLSFVVSASAGSTFAMLSLRAGDGGDLMWTFVGWTIYAGLIAVLFSLMPEFWRIIRNFWSAPSRANNETSQSRVKETHTEPLSADLASTKASAPKPED